MTAQEQAEQLARKAHKASYDAYYDEDASANANDEAEVQAILRATNLAALIEEKEAWKRDAELLMTYVRHDERGCEKGFLPHLPCACGLDAIGNNHFALVEKYKE